MSEDAAPAVRIVRGAPDEVELAALVAGLVAANTPFEDESATSAHRWADPVRRVRGATAWRPGPDVWRWSLRD